MTKSAKAQFRAHFREYVEEELKLDFDSLGDAQRSHAMTQFYVAKVVRPINPGLVPEEEEDLQSCLVDASDDCGVDFISRDGNHVLIVQAKYSGTKKKGQRAIESSSDFEAFRGVLTKLFALPKSKRANSALREAVAEIDWDKDHFDLRYITLRQTAQNSRQSADEGVHPVTGLPGLEDRSALELLDEEQLNIELRNALSADHGAPELVEMIMAPNGDAPRYWALDEGRKALIGRLQASQLTELFRQYKSALFALNLRNYVGDNATNKAIRQTAFDHPNDFFFFNNGISALASDIEEIDETTIRCKNFSIINGAQTVRSLSKVQTLPDGKEKARQTTVLIRISEVSRKVTPSEQDFLERVTRFNNTQNAVKISDFRSNDAVQRDLHDRWAAVKARGGKKFIYKNKRSGEPTGGKIPITMSEFVPTLYSFLFGPSDMFGGTSHLFNPSSEEDGGYYKLFGDGLGEIRKTVASEDFKLYVGIWFLCEYAKEQWKDWKKTHVDDSHAEALERRWIVFYALHVALQTVYASMDADLTADLKTLSDPSWNDPTASEKGAGQRRVIDRYLVRVYKALRKAYEIASKESSFRHRNWFRSADTLAAVKTEINYLFEDVAEDDWESFQLRRRTAN